MLLKFKCIRFSKYHVITQQGYSKYYYTNGTRIANRLGDNNTTIAIDNMLENRKLSLEERFGNEIQELISEPTQVDLPPVLDILNLQPTGTPNDIYYYHPNHLGSTAFVTDNNATITQGFLYAPFGEITTEYNINFGNNTIPKYAFNAKELDEETGMYYYEVRYYAPPVFTSRDPLFEKYPTFSPYTYCANNPVKYVDPDGKKVVITGDDSEEATNQLNSSTSEHFIIIRNDDGSLSYQGKAITKRDRIIKKAIDDRTITVNIEASKNNMFIWQDGANLGTECGGGYGGNSVKDGLVNTYQKVVPSMLDKRDNDVEGRSSGLYMLHEVAESYFGGIIAQRTGKSSPREGLYGTTYSKAHRRANRIAGGEYNYRKEEETIRYPDGSPVINPLTGEPVRKVIFEGYSRY